MAGWRASPLLCLHHHTCPTTATDRRDTRITSSQPLAENLHIHNLCKKRFFARFVYWIVWEQTWMNHARNCCTIKHVCESIQKKIRFLRNEKKIGASRCTIHISIFCLRLTNHDSSENWQTAKDQECYAQISECQAWKSQGGNN